MIILSDALSFPNIELADKDGLLCIGGDLSVERLILAYTNGIFPWYNEGEPICWWCPNPRFILLPQELKVSKSMRKVITENKFNFTINKAFTQVITNCKTTPRKGQDGTWIQHEVVDAYTKLHHCGVAISAEAWQNNTLVGGLYGIKLGNIFFGESMFSHITNASKFAFINFVKYLQTQNIQLIDCQIYTEHLKSFGAKMMDRKDFFAILNKEI